MPYSVLLVESFLQLIKILTIIVKNRRAMLTTNRKPYDSRILSVTNQTPLSSRVEFTANQKPCSSRDFLQPIKSL